MIEWQIQEKWFSVRNNGEFEMTVGSNSNYVCQWALVLRFCDAADITVLMLLCRC